MSALLLSILMTVFCLVTATALHVKALAEDAFPTLRRFLYAGEHRS